MRQSGTNCGNRLKCNQVLCEYATKIPSSAVGRETHESKEETWKLNGTQRGNDERRAVLRDARLTKVTLATKEKKNDQETLQTLIVRYLPLCVIGVIVPIRVDSFVLAQHRTLDLMTQGPTMRH